MRFARSVFLLAAIYGLIVTTPLLFMEQKIGRDTPPAVTHPEFFYGFAILVIAWQIVFVIISRDPIRFRPLMLVGIVEKCSFVIPVPILFALGRVSMQILGFALIDALLLVLFAISYAKTSQPK